MRPEREDLGKRKSSWFCLLLFIGLVPNYSFAGPLEYRLQTGDVIEIRVAGMPDLNQRVAVQLDGSIAIAAAGTLLVEGETVSEMRSRVQTAFASRLLPSVGQEASQSRSVARDAVAVSVVEYLPVWASGDVKSPGPRQYSSQMTVRQLIAAAGGVLRPEQIGMAARYDPLTLASLYRETGLELAGLAARSWRLKAELGDAHERYPAKLPDAPVSSDELAAIVDGELDIRRTREEGRRHEKSFLQRSIQSGTQEIAALEEQLRLAAENEAADEAEYARTKELLDKGTVTNSRLIRLSSGRALLVHTSARNTVRADKAAAPTDRGRKTPRNRKQRLVKRGA